MMGDLLVKVSRWGNDLRQQIVESKAKPKMYTTEKKGVICVKISYNDMDAYLYLQEDTVKDMCFNDFCEMACFAIENEYSRMRYLEQ